MLELRGVSSGYGSADVLHKASLRVAGGEILALVGANGAGKSTLAKTASGLLRPTSGEILLDGTRIDTLSTAERLRLGIAHVPEGRLIFSGMTIAENLALGGSANPGSGREEDVYSLFPILRARSNTQAGNLSGGQQQMLAIARGLMSCPRFLILDEPSLGLAPLLVREIFALLATLRARGLGILLIEQNARAALEIADHGVVIEGGRIALADNAAKLRNAPEVAAKYLGVGSPERTNAEHIGAVADRLRSSVVGKAGRQ